MVELGDTAVAHSAVFGPDGLPYLRGRKKKKKGSQMFLLLPTSSVRIISFLHESRLYQAGTAEYAQVQAACLCQLHNGLKGGNQKQRRG